MVLSHHIKLEYGLTYSLVGIMFILIGTVWGLSFSVPSDVEKPASWILENRTGLFSIYLLSGLALLALFVAILITTQVITPTNLVEVILLPGILFVSTTVLLLSSFFTVPSHEGNQRFYDTHPLIFYTAVSFIVLGVISTLISHIKIKSALDSTRLFKTLA